MCPHGVSIGWDNLQCEACTEDMPSGASGEANPKRELPQDDAGPAKKRGRPVPRNAFAKEFQGLRDDMSDFNKHLSGFYLKNFCCTDVELKAIKCLRKQLANAKSALPI